MTTHTGHDHPNTKAGRAACRRAGTAQPTDLSDRIHDEAAAERKVKKPKRAKQADPALPHEFDSDIDKPARCYVCKRAKSASVHSDGPRDLGMLFNFGGN